MEALRSALSKNPHKNARLKPIEIRFEADMDDTAAKGVGPGGLNPIFMDPPGPVSLYLWITDPMYRIASPQVRRVMLRESLLTMASAVEEECRGVKWHRKKVLEQLAAQQTAAVSTPQDTWELDRALAHIYGYQKILVDEANKKVHFIPADPRTWSTENPVWIVGLGSRAVFHAGTDHDCRGVVAAWVSSREADGWTVGWPEADGTLETIRNELAQIDVDAAPRVAKPKKEDWARLLGRMASIRALVRFTTMSSSDTQ